MHPLSRLTLLLTVLLVTPAMAASLQDFQVDQAEYQGTLSLEGDLVAGQLVARASPLATITARGADIRIVNENVSSPRAAGVAGYLPERDSGNRSNGAGQLDGLAAPMPELTIIGAGAHLQAAGRAFVVQTSTTSEVRERDYINASRTVLQANVSSFLQVQEPELSFVRITGTFAFSLFGWNTTFQDKEGRADYPTGAFQTGRTATPVTNTEVHSTTFEQVIQVYVIDGELQISGLNQASWNLFVANADVNGTGQALYTGASPPTKESPAGTVLMTGSFSSSHQVAGNQLTTNVTTLDGAMQVDGSPIDLLPDLRQPTQEPGTVIDSPTTSGGWNWWTPAASILAIALVAGVIHGPMANLRFQHIERAFADGEYVRVLNRVDPFTSRRRHRRRANFLKAMSLLSAGHVREAQLYLETLTASTGPDPATRAFLQACAAAAQGQDSTAIEHMTTCLNLDPSYIQEAEHVPALRGIIPYFQIEGGPA